ncbi:MAG: hypothetical protein ACO3VB_09330, partial [Opitutales bacterium]
KKMKIISHRGNLSGPSEKENSANQIIETIKQGFDCEVDVWCIDSKIFLGHDAPTYRIEERFLHQDGLWIHAKNLEALDWLYNTSLNYFWHETDKVTITSHGYIWCYPGIFLESGITVLQNREEYLPEKILGICTDYPSDYI